MRGPGVHLAIIVLSLATAVGAASAEVSKPPKPLCFLSHDWNGWKASPDSKSLYIRVGASRLYRLDMASACPALSEIGVHLVTRTRGSSWICHPLDLDLKVADDHGFRGACIVSAITPLSDAEAAALPKALRP